LLLQQADIIIIVIRENNALFLHSPFQLKKVMLNLFLIQHYFCKSCDKTWDKIRQHPFC